MGLDLKWLRFPDPDPLDIGSWEGFLKPTTIAPAGQEVRVAEKDVAGVGHGSPGFG